MAHALIVQRRAAAAPQAFVIYEEMKALAVLPSVAVGFINHLYTGFKKMISD